nr:MAG TPA: hypothetical protein [Caudoviricetes sp.]
MLIIQGAWFDVYIPTLFFTLYNCKLYLFRMFLSCIARV